MTDDTAPSVTYHDYIVNVTVVDRYWDVQVWINAVDIEDAKRQVEQRFEELKALGVSADFAITDATSLEDWRAGEFWRHS